MTNFIPPSYQFSKVKICQIEINFTDGDISSDGGVLLLREADKRLGITNELAKCFLINEMRVRLFIVYNQ